MNADILRQQGNQAGKFMPVAFDILKAGQPKVFNIELGDDDSTAFLMGEDVTIAAKGLDTTYDKLVVKLFDESTYTLVKALSYDASAVFSVSLMSGENMGLVNGYVTQDSVNLKAMTASGGDGTPALYIDPVYADANKETVEALGEFTVLPVFLMTSPDSSDKSLALLSKKSIPASGGVYNIVKLSEYAGVFSRAYCNFKNGLVSPIQLDDVTRAGIALKISALWRYPSVALPTGGAAYGIPDDYPMPSYDDTIDFLVDATEDGRFSDYAPQVYTRMNAIPYPNGVEQMMGENAFSFCAIVSTINGNQDPQFRLRVISFCTAEVMHQVTIEGKSYSHYFVVREYPLSESADFKVMKDSLSTPLSQSGFLIYGISGYEFVRGLKRVGGIDMTDENDSYIHLTHSGASSCPTITGLSDSAYVERLFTALFRKLDDDKVYMRQLYIITDFSGFKIGSISYPHILAYKDFATNITLTE